MRNTLFVSLGLLLSCSLVSAQSVWSKSHLDNVRSEIDRPLYSRSYEALRARADSLLQEQPLSVMMKEKTPPSGDKHDYTSLARYFHPNLSTPDGLPYVNRDGITNPEIVRWDRIRLGETADRIADLSLAWYFSGDERYAKKATELIDVWFLNPDTRMNPNFNYAQFTPGHNDNKGRCYGVLDGYSFVNMLDGVQLLSGSKSWTQKKDRKLKKWMTSLLDWILTSEQGIEESNQQNNHSVACDVLTVAVAMYAGKNDVAERIIREFPEKRMYSQINADGKQPHEMGRTLSYHYSQYNLSHMIDLFMMGRKFGLEIDNAKAADGRGDFYKAMDFLAAYLDKDVAAWPGQQISGFEEKKQDVARDLWRTAAFLDSSRDDYKTYYRRCRSFDPADRFNLLYYSADDVDDAYVLGAASLRHAIDRVRIGRDDRANAAGRKVSPRSVDKNGRMTLVHPHDWTSGFFPGELWMMYEFTNDPFWRIEAISHTWPIEESKLHGGTHDLGFMIGDSFGKAWELTGEQSYLDVAEQASRTLCTRFNPSVGAIRSWDHNSDVWQYPVIIDNMMNLEMLFKMSKATGDPRFREIAISHADVTLKNHFRPDGSTYHVVDYDLPTGKPRMKVTHQGYSDDSFWSRGQGWAIYGFTMCYRYTGEKRYLDQATKTADWFLSLPNMPEDRIPYWDMKAPGTESPDNVDIPRDASAAAIIASALYELAAYVPVDKAVRYIAEADAILDSLGSETYTSMPEENEGFILRHSTGHHPGGSEIDVPLVYADYYYLEALKRKRAIAN